jgi:hypothetical protein
MKMGELLSVLTFVKGAAIKERGRQEEEKRYR